MDKYTVVIILTTIGFFALAAALLVPIWRFLNSEEARSRQWTAETRLDDGNEPAEPESPASASDGDEGR